MAETPFTVEQWLTVSPTTEEMRAGNFRETEQEQEAHKALILGVFEGVEKGKLASLITDAVGALYTADPRYAVEVTQHLYETLKKDYILSQLPPSLVKLLAIITEER